MACKGSAVRIRLPPPGRLRLKAASLSSRGLGHRPFTAVTGVRIPLGTPKVERGAVVQSVRIPACHAGGRGFESRPLRQPLSVMQRKKPPLGGFFLLRSVALTVTADRRVRKRGHCRYACCMKQRRGCTWPRLQKRRGILWLCPLKRYGRYARRIDSKNSALFFVALILSSKNSVASRSSMPYRSLRSTHIFGRTEGSRSSSSRRVPERFTLIAG